MKYSILAAALLLSACHPCTAQDLRPCDDEWRALQVLLEIKQYRAIKEMQDEIDRSALGTKIRANSIQPIIIER